MNQKSENLISEIIQNRRLIRTLAKNDFKTKFSGSYLGTVWAFVQPVITVLIYWFVFDMAIGARAQIRGELPLPYVHIDILPVVKIFSSIFVHVFFVAVAVLLFLLYGYFPDLYVLQALYYSAGVLLLALGMSYFTSAVSVFFPDVRQIVNIGLQIGVWATPIMWDINDMKEKIPEAVLIIMKCNPLYYIVLGYREAFIDKVWFWEHPGMTLYFWGFTLTVCLLGVKVFKRLKVHFADVL